MTELQHEVPLRRHPTEAARARQQVAQFCAAMSDDACSTAQLLTSELVTNAINHGTGAISLRLSTLDHQLRVEVADESPRAPTVQRASSEELSGRGLMLLETLATAWGITAEPDEQGKIVWFTLDRL